MNNPEQVVADRDSSRRRRKLATVLDVQKMNDPSTKPTISSCTRERIAARPTRGSTTVIVLIIIMTIASALDLQDDSKMITLVQAGGSSNLSVNHYVSSCPAVENIVRNSMQAQYQKDRKIAAHVLRLHFHDCASTGCDASLLLNGSKSEQVAIPNLTLEGYDVVENIKSQLEANCSGVVSCSDILALAARDAVFLWRALLPITLRPIRFEVVGGSSVSLPTPDISIPGALSFFNSLGLSTLDMVVLLGGHTLGAAHCSSFSDRLFNFNNTGRPDPSLDAAFLASLRQMCPRGRAVTTTVALDINSEYVFDNHFYVQVTKRHGVLRIDDEIRSSKLTSHLVNVMAVNKKVFFTNFAQSMIKLSNVGVKNATSGKIRTRCFAA